MRLWLPGPIGVLAIGLYLEASVQVLTAYASSGAILWAIVALAALFVNSYLWKRWWLSGMVAWATGTFLWWFFGGAWHFGLLMPVAFAVLVGWWSRQKFNWPLEPVQAFLAIVILALVSLALSGMLAARIRGIDTHTPLALAVLYLSTPPWEWTIVIAVLAQSRHLRAFVAENYRLRRGFWRHVGLGLGAGLGMIAVTVLAVLVESQGFHVHIQANNPFVFAPGLQHHQRWWPPVLVALGVVVLAPLAEEALFRGVLFRTLNAHWGYLIGTLVSAALFGLVHLDLSLFVPLAMAGLVLNALYHRTGSLVPSTVAHATLNAVSVFSALGAAGLYHL